jgi:hypothetical protein
LDCKQQDERQRILQEAREALHSTGVNVNHIRGNANSGSNHLSQQQFGFAKTYNPRSMSADLRTIEEKAAVDPRLWYLLGLILCDLRLFREARLVYRQVLSRLPMSCFGHVVHYNLACLQSLQAEDASREASHLEASQQSLLSEASKSLRVVTFQPGAPGMSERNGNIAEVHAGGQAERIGVKVGWRITAVRNQKCESLQDRVFLDARDGSTPFEVTFMKACRVTALRERAEAAKVAALRDLKEFRRHCRALQSMGSGRSIGACELCGAPQ